MRLLKKAIVFIFLTFPLITHAQTYHPFPDSLGRWYEQGYFCWDDCQVQAQCNGNGWVYDQGRDTIINGLKYFFIGTQPSWSYNTISNEVVSTINDSVNFPGGTIGAIREDSLKKIWFLPFSIFQRPAFSIYPCYSHLDSVLDKEILLYDFEMKKGDTFHLSSTDFEVLLKIDSVQLGNGEYRRRFNFGFDSILTNYGNWIEGIGSTSGLFGSYYDCDLECSGQGLCSFGINDSAIYPYSGIFYDCSHTSRVVVSVNNINPDPHFTIFPQPADDYFTVSLSSLPANTSISIFNIVGQQVYQRALNEQNTIINTNQIGVPGIYIAKLMDGNNNSYIKKVIIQ